MSISRCSRCGDFSYERLRTHGFCWGCNHSEDFDIDDKDLATWVMASRLVDEEEKRQNAEQQRLARRALVTVSQEDAMVRQVC
jgi:hypothetical protein